MMTLDRKDFGLLYKLILSYLAFYEIRVPRTIVLHPASLDSASPRTPLLLVNLYVFGVPPPIKSANLPILSTKFGPKTAPSVVTEQWKTLIHQCL